MKTINLDFSIGDTVYQNKHNYCTLLTVKRIIIEENDIITKQIPRNLQKLTSAKPFFIPSMMQKHMTFCFQNKI